MALDKQKMKAVNARDASLIWECVGIVETLIAHAKWFQPPRRFCPPPTVNTEIAMRELVKYLADKPSLAEDDLRGVALISFGTIWPCTGSEPND
ncbi:MAG TPA: hypothetical protein VFB13_17540 [Reyranella sp.]|jgi:hypothetical protein|nr:hypothetical protein [Reyranella sp.]